MKVLGFFDIYRCDPCGVVPSLGRRIIVGSTPITYTNGPRDRQVKSSAFQAGILSSSLSGVTIWDRFFGETRSVKPQLVSSMLAYPTY